MTDAIETARAYAAEWDERYTSLAAVAYTPAEPNPVLATEVASLAPGRALDIGCGFGAEAIWLASHGWRTTAMDVSAVAVEHAKLRSMQAGVELTWLTGRIEDVAAPGFDLVTAFYPALRHSRGEDAANALLGAVAPEGTLLVVHHADVDVAKAKSYGFDPADYLSHDDIAQLVKDWDVRIDRRRPRETPAGVDGQHSHDDVLVARRIR